MTTVRLGMLRRDLGYWRVAAAHLGRNAARYGKPMYSMAQADVGLYPLAQLHAWVNSEGHGGAYYSIGGGGRWHVPGDPRQVIISAFGRGDAGWYWHPSVHRSKY